MDPDADMPVTETYSRALLEAVIAATPAWITRAMRDVIVNERGLLTPDDEVAIDAAAKSVARTVRSKLTRLLSLDVDDQSMNPLAVLRASTSAATDALRALGLREIMRDEYEKSSLPDDVYSIGPLTWRDLSEDVHDAGITWGAWKAATVLSRRRAEGKIT